MVIFALAVASVSVSLLDLAAIYLISVVSERFSASESRISRHFIEKYLSGSFSLSDETLTLILGILAVLLLLLRSTLSFALSRFAFHFLGDIAAKKSSELYRKFMGNPELLFKNKSSQIFAESLNTGTTSTITVVIGSWLLIVSEVSLLLILSIGLFRADSGLALILVFSLALLAFVIGKLLAEVVKTVSLSRISTDISALQLIQESFFMYREIFVSHLNEFFINKFQEFRYRANYFQAKSNWLALTPKYLIESSLILAIAFFGGYLVIQNKPEQAFATISVFLASSTRILPSLLRLQSGFLAIQGSYGPAKLTMELETKIEKSLQNPSIQKTLSVTESNGFTGLFVPRLEINRLSFFHEGSSHSVLDDISLLIEPAQRVLITGESGSGKSTLLDLIIGIRTPSEGTISLSSVSPRDAIKTWPGDISYVPQRSHFINGSILENITLGRLEKEHDSYELDWIWEIIELVHLGDFLRTLPNSLETSVGEAGSRLSGGQRQRLAIARALFSNPKFMVLDEATNALDPQLEAKVMNSIYSCSRNMSFVSIIHRSNDLQNFDKTYLLKSGKLFEC